MNNKWRCGTLKVYKVSQVFVTGGMPQYTYVPRLGKKLEERLRLVQDNLCKLVTVTGTTKSGKTVLTSKIFPRYGDSIWIDGGTVQTENDLWDNILVSLDAFTNTEETNTKTHSGGISGEMSTTAGLPLFAAAAGTVSADYGHERTRLNGRSRTISSRTAAIRALHQVKHPLIIDDFHYLSRSFQGAIIRALKPLIFEGLPVIFIAIPHRRYDAIKIEREMTGRLDNINIPSWDIDELKNIPHEGFPLLNINVDSVIIDRFAKEAFGSPHLMQEFCRKLCDLHGITQTVDSVINITGVDESIFKQVAEGTGKVIFDRLTKGPRQRSDRLQRQLKNGENVDIYKVALLALVKIAPGLDTIEYEQIRSAMRELLQANIPQAHEVSRVFEHMSKIAADDESSTPVLDWEKQDRKLHITDPYFAFYLRWGVLLPHDRKAKYDY